MGLLLVAVVHAADVQDRDGARGVLERAKALFPTLQLVWADGGYAGALVGWAKEVCGWVLQTVLRPLHRVPEVRRANVVAIVVLEDDSGLPVLIEANVASAREADLARDAGAAGIGLVRTELLFFGRLTPPGADEQLANIVVAQVAKWH